MGSVDIDTIVIASADSTRQVGALARHVRDKLKEAGATIIGTEGEAGGEWVLVDCGDAVVHVLQPAIRAYYNLEEIWGDKSVRLKSSAPASIAGKKSRKAPARRTA